MDKKIKEAWLKALRSEKYAQGYGQLCRTGDDGVDHFCCLGVLIDIAADGDWRLTQKGWTFKGQRCIPPAAFLDEVGLDWDLSNELAEDNDEGLSFKQIANKIESRA